MPHKEAAALRFIAGIVGCLTMAEVITPAQDRSSASESPDWSLAAGQLRDAIAPVVHYNPWLGGPMPSTVGGVSGRAALIVVCIEMPAATTAISQAEKIGSQIFATADVTIQWQRWSRCPSDSVRISTVQVMRVRDDGKTPLAYAFPYEGSHIVLDWSRITSRTDSLRLPRFLAHILVHEVTHILQGVPRHSATGVMKAEFSAADISEMQRHSLQFTPEDLKLIEAGIRERHERLAAGMK